MGEGKKRSDLKGGEGEYRSQQKRHTITGEMEGIKVTEDAGGVAQRQ